MNIKEAEVLSGVSRRNIRFYEQKGLLKPGRNRENDYREYSEGDITTLKLIRALRMLDMPLEKIRDVLEGKLSLNIAVTEHKQKLCQRIKELETAVHFCDAFTTAECLNVEEVLCQMDKPENRENLSKRGEWDHADTIIRVIALLGAGLIPCGAGVIFGLIALVCVTDMPVLSWAMTVTALVLWGAFGCWLWGQGNWLRNGLLIHVIPLVSCICYFCAGYFAVSPIQEALDLIAVYGYLPIIGTYSPVVVAVNTLGLSEFAFIVPIILMLAAFCLGGAHGKFRECRKANALKDAPA